MLIDTHSHLNFNAFKDDVDEVIRRSLVNNVWMSNVGSQYETSKKAVEIAEKYPQGVYAAIGLHPIYAKESFNYDEYKKLAESKKVVAIGEIGLDYKAEYVSFKERQEEVFLQQLNLAKELNLPVIFHCRMAHDDLLDILRNQKCNNYTGVNLLHQGVIHCFTGSWEQAQTYLEMELYLGFNGIIFKLDLDEVINKTPLDKILIETDCPYLTPPPENGRNEPMYVKYVAEKIAKIKNLRYEEVAKITTQNAKKFFGMALKI
jgi:TatD DNase family protein